MDWKTFWDRPNAIYVNERHAEAHYRAIAADLAALVERADERVLDHGCGEARHADRVAAICGHLFLLDTAPSVRAKLAERFAGTANVTILALEDLAGVPDGTLDLVVVNSVLQYLSDADLDAALVQWRAKLAPGGRLVIADVIPPDVSAVTDALALLRFAAREGFLPAAILGLARTALSPYRKLRQSLGLSTHTSGGMVARLTSAGFAAVRMPRNLGHNPARMTFLARPA